LDEPRKLRSPLKDTRADVKIKISALWIGVMFYYIYADYFGLYVPGTLQDMLKGKMGPLGPTTQGILLGTSLMMAIPAAMIFLSVALSPRLNRWLNIVVGTIYTVIILITMWNWAFYIFYGVIEVVFTALVVWYAWNWPREREECG
jgi:hypothetical protein